MLVHWQKSVIILVALRVKYVYNVKPVVRPYAGSSRQCGILAGRLTWLV